MPPSSRRSTSLFNPPMPAPARQSRWSKLYGAGESLAIAKLAAKCDAPLMVVVRDMRRLQTLQQELQFFLHDVSDTNVIHFPDWECLPYELFSPHPDIVSARLKVLAGLPQLKSAVVLVTVANLAQRLPPLEYVAGHSLNFKRGDVIEIDALRQQLLSASYYTVSQVVSPGEFAVRGGLVDLFAMGASQPVRIDLFDNCIDTIKFFDPQTQCSTAPVDSIELLAAREFPMTESAITLFRQNFRQYFDGDPSKQVVYKAVSNARAVAGLEFFFPLFFERTATLFDYAANAACWLFDDDTQATLAQFQQAVATRFANAADPERRLLAPQELFLSPKEFNHALSGLRRIYLDSSSSKAVTMATIVPDEVAVNPHSDNPYGDFINFVKDCDQRLLIVAETAGRRQNLEDVLDEQSLTATRISSWGEFNSTNSERAIVVAELERGLKLSDPPLNILTEAQLYGQRGFARRRQSQASKDPESIIRSLAEVKLGDPVVHEKHGIGRYMGLATLTINAKLEEFMLLTYKDDDKLYVPILALDRINRYMGGDADNAPLYKLGGEAWGKACKKARAKAYDVATELLEVAALRAARKGMAMRLSEHDYQQFCNNFAFEETPDQAQAIGEIIKDLQSDTPMDRLVCGDVGFGKTEVAMRAAFIAVMNNTQVVLLAPTTLLAQQHLQTFEDRFAGLAVKVALLSRFQTAREVSALVEAVEQKAVDILIGTHRLLQAKVKFNNLGLLIIDEEHRFGVRQKERLKKMRSQVDILTLTATPIPRTLNLSIAGLKSISIIATAPKERLAIKTVVRPYARSIIKEAITREIQRGGQVYFLHNEVQSINRVAAELAELMPDIEIRVGHGQLPAVELERVMRDFYHQRCQVLLCTTIIENGIDIPNANTIIINRADKLGLAQLHQLRGRVGRSHRQAFAYLLVPELRTLNANAKKRLEAIAAFEDLGAGFMLASHDMEIRGVGELLGEHQSGAIDTVGFNLFSEYLNKAVADLQTKAGKNTPLTLPKARAAEVSLNVEALLPSDFITDVHVRLVLYKRIASSASDMQLRELQAEIIDRFGPLPEAAQNLFQLTALSHTAAEHGVKTIILGDHGGKIAFSQAHELDPTKIITLIQQQPRIFSLADSYTLKITHELPELDDRTKFARRVLAEIGG